MKKLTTLIFAFLLLAGPVLADGPSPLDWQKEYFRQNKQVQARILDHDWEVANLENQVFDLQVINKELREENANLRINPETIVYEREVEVLPWWSWIPPVVGFVLGAAIF